MNAAIATFVVFAFCYFLSALLRGVTATLAPVFTAELGLAAGDLGLLAGAYFFGFATTQLPLGSALDRHGSKRVLLVLLTLAVLGCAAFAMSRQFGGLALARVLIGVGVSACLMAPLAAFRRGLGTVAQLRANSWMLMAGSTGMVASTLPVQWLLPLIGWRGLFWLLAGSVLVGMIAIAFLVPRDAPTTGPRARADGSYADVWRHPTFVRFAPMGFFHHGGLIAVQSLWAGPWLVEVCRWTPAEAAQGLFAINVTMLVTFLSWGGVVPSLYSRGWTAQRLITIGAPASLGALAVGLWLGAQATAWTWVLFCAGCSVVALAQPAVAQPLPPSLAGRALSAYNLVVFLGIFTLQWGMGVAIDAFRDLGWSVVSAYRGAFALLWVCIAGAYVWFLCRAEAPAAQPLNQPV